MATATAAAAAKSSTKKEYPPEFTVEFGDECNRTITINTLKFKVRGQWSLTSLFSRKGIGGRDVGSAMSAMPDTPGIRLKVSPRQRKALFYDPLERDPRLLERINAVRARAQSIGSANKTSVQESPYELDDDQMKTLCLEIVAKQKDGEIHAITKGRLPTETELEEMPGLQLNDPWSSNPHKPTYAKDYFTWARKMDVPRA